MWFIHLLTPGENSIFARLRGAVAHFGGQARQVNRGTGTILPIEIWSTYAKASVGQGSPNCFAVGKMMENQPAYAP